MRESHSPQEIVGTLRGSGARRIAIDGKNGSGKSTLSRELGAKLGYKVLHLDDYVAKNKGAYVINLDKEGLAQAIASLDEYVLEGICLLQVLGTLSVEFDELIYVKRINHGHWADAHDLDPQLPIETHLAQLRTTVRRIAQALGEPGSLGLSEEVIRYHDAFRPHEKATMTYLRNVT